MSRIYPAGQSASAEFAFHNWLGLYMEGYASVNPILAAEGLMEETVTRGKNYHVTVPPLAMGDTVEEADGNDWPASFMQGAEVKGTIGKARGPRGLEFTEDDLLEDAIPLANANVTAHAQAVKMFPDKMGALALEGGLTATGFDNRPIFDTTHAKDPVKGASTNVNSYNLGMSPGNVRKVIAGFYQLKAENNDPIFANANLSFSLIVPTQLKPDAEDIVDRMYVSDGTTTVSNTAYKVAKLVVVPQLTDPARWYVAINNLRRKPILRVQFRAMKRFELGPTSDLWNGKRMMKMYSNEKADYKLVDWRLLATSKG